MPAIAEAFALVTGRVRLPRRLFDAGARGPYPLPALSFALRAEEDWYLVDAGARPGWVPVFGRFGQSWPLMGRLVQLGCSRASIRGVVATHLDVDHAGGLPELADVPLHVHRREHLHALKPTWGERLLRRYRRGDVTAPRLVTQHDLVPAVEGQGVGCFEQVADIFDDGSVVLVDLGGHSAGHVGVLVTLTDERRILFCGDAAFTRAHIRGGPLGLFPRRIAYDRVQMEATLAGLCALQRDEPDLRIIPSHDSDIGERCIDKPLKL